jgi:hypothetical protein
MNDNKKGTTIVELYAALADGNKEAVLGFNRCPRCGIKYNRVSFKRNYFDDIKLLEFSNFLALKEDEKVTYLERIANLSLRKTLFFRRGLVS